MDYVIELKFLNAEMILRNFTMQTMKAYLFWNCKFLDFVKKSPRSVANADLNDFLL